LNLPELPPSAAGSPLKAASAPHYPGSRDPAPAFGGFVFNIVADRRTGKSSTGNLRAA